MSIRIEPYSRSRLDGIVRLNRRLREGRVEEGFLLPEDGPDATDRSPSPPLVKRHYLVLDGEDVRGGLILQEQTFVVAGSLRPVANLQMPVSEGLVNRKYAYLGAAMLKLVLAEHPLLFSVGMGGASQPLPRLLAALRWRIAPVPFLFRVHHCRRFLKEIGPLRGAPLGSLAAQFAANSGVGWAGIRLTQAVRRLASGGGSTRAPSLKVTRVEQWGGWVDELWERYRPGCLLAAMRDSRTLPLFHPLDDGRVIALKFALHGEPAGWAALLATEMRDDRYFGGLKVGTLLDAVALPGCEDAVVAQAAAQLEERGADLIVANHLHGAWLGALRRLGFLGAPSNFLLALSPQLADALGTWDKAAARIHICRADGDGRIHL